jgi:hypothetical protein
VASSKYFLDTDQAGLGAQIQADRRRHLRL